MLFSLATLEVHCQNEKKEKKTLFKPGPKLHVCFSLSYNEVKRGYTVLPPSNHLVNHMCVCVIFLFLTSFLASILAPAPNNSSSVAVRPYCEAIMRAVEPPFKHRGRERHTP